MQKRGKGGATAYGEREVDRGSEIESGRDERWWHTGAKGCCYCCSEGGMGEGTEGEDRERQGEI